MSQLSYTAEELANHVVELIDSNKVDYTEAIRLIKSKSVEMMKRKSDAFESQLKSMRSQILTLEKV